LKKEDVSLEEKWFAVIAFKTDAGIRKVPISDKVFPTLNTGWRRMIVNIYFQHLREIILNTGIITIHTGLRSLNK